MSGKASLTKVGPVSLDLDHAAFGLDLRMIQITQGGRPLGYAGSMSFKVLVPLDGSPQSEAVFPLLRFLASKTKLEVELLRCFEPPASIYMLPELSLQDAHPLSVESLTAAILEYLKEKQACLPGVDTTPYVRCATAAQEIVEAGQSADLILMAAHGRSGLGPLLLGSTTARVTRLSQTPVLVVPHEAASPPALNTILVAVDGTPAGDQAFRKALDLAQAFDARLVLYRAVLSVLGVAPRPDQLEEAERHLSGLAQAHPGRVTKTLVQLTDGSPDILECADEVRADLVVLGSHTRGNVSRWLLGSVAEDVLHHARCPVLIARGSADSTTEMEAAFASLAGLTGPL